MRREFPVLSYHGPFVAQCARLPHTLIDHRLNREDDTGPQLRSALALPIVRNLRLFVHRSAYAMSHIFTHDRKAARLCIVLDRPRNIFQIFARPRLFDRRHQRAFRCFEQTLGDIGYVPDRKRPSSVADKAVIDRADVNRDNIALVQHALGVRNPVYDFAIDGGTQRAGKSVIPFESGFGISLGNERVRKRVEFCGANAGFYFFANRFEKLGDDPSGFAHLRDFVLRLDNDHNSATALTRSACTCSMSCSPFTWRNKPAWR